MSVTLESVLLPVPPEFRFSECLRFLARSSNECLHTIEAEALYKALRYGKSQLVLRIEQAEPDTLRLTFLNGAPAGAQQAAITYVSEWLDLNTDLAPFYSMAETDPILGHVCQSYFGLRLIGIPDLFEALVWAIIGQQINLTFAFRLKRRFVEAFGEKVLHDGHTYWFFPPPEALRGVTLDAFAGMQFSAKKIEYILAVADLMRVGDLSKENLMEVGHVQAHQLLLGLRGVGEWTAHYVSMKCLRNSAAFPNGDAGLQNALKSQMGLAHKPAVADMLALGKQWSGWEAYATFYLWRSLL